MVPSDSRLIGADIGPSRAGFEVAVVFERRKDPTALLMLVRQFCLTLAPAFEAYLGCLMNLEAGSLSDLAFAFDSGSVVCEAETVVGEGMSTFAC